MSYCYVASHTAFGVRVHQNTVDSCLGVCYHCWMDIDCTHTCTSDCAQEGCPVVVAWDEGEGQISVQVRYPIPMDHVTIHVVPWSGVALPPEAPDWQDSLGL